jgi:hypothetical protein
MVPPGSGMSLLCQHGKAVLKSSLRFVLSILGNAAERPCPILQNLHGMCGCHEFGERQTWECKRGKNSCCVIRRDFSSGALLEAGRQI